MTKDFVAGEQFRGYLAGVALDVAQESLVRRPAFFYLRQFRLPAPGHFHVGDVHALHDGIQGKPFFRRYERLLHAHHVFAPEQGLDDGGTGGGRADAAVLQRLPRFLVLHALASSGLHCRQQGAFRVQRLRTGHARTHRAAVHRQRVALLPVGQYGVLPVLAIDRTPARLADDAPFGFKRHAFALRTDGRRVLDALRGERFYHAPHNHVVDELLVLVECQRTVGCNQQRMVVGHFRGVHAAAVQFTHIFDFIYKR